MTETRRLPAPIAVGGAVMVGVLTAIQARVNGALGVEFDDGIVAGFVSFGSGLVLVGIIAFAVPSLRAGVLRLWSGFRAREIPLWMLCGGFCGSLTVATQGLTAGIIGVALFTVGVVAGQTLHGLVLDRIGFGPAGVVAVTPGRVLGGLLALVAVGISLTGDVLGRVPLWMLVLPFLVGVGIAWQQAANGRLAQRVASPATATFMNFVAGTALLAVAAAVSVLVRGIPQTPPAAPWLYLGGALGVTYIFLGAFLVAHTGVLLLGLGSVLGQITAALAIDLIWPPVSGPAVWQMIAMTAAATFSVLVAFWRPRRTA